MRGYESTSEAIVMRLKRGGEDPLNLDVTPLKDAPAEQTKAAKKRAKKLEQQEGGRGLPAEPPG